MPLGVAPAYELVYFDLKAYGEVARLQFAAAGVTYTDTRYAYAVVDDSSVFDPAWLRDRSDLKRFAFSRIPILIVDGKHVINQSAAINRFLAGRFGFLGRTDLEAAHIGSVLDQLVDIRAHLNSHEDSERVQWLAEHLPRYLTQLEAFTLRYGTAAAPAAGVVGGIVGDRLSLADIQLFFWDSSLSLERKQVDDLYAVYAPTVRVILDAVAALPGIAAWVAGRPLTIY